MGLLHFWQEAFPTRQKKLSIREICIHNVSNDVKTSRLKDSSVASLDNKWQPATEAGELVCDFCQRTSLTRVEPTEVDLEDLRSRLTSLNWAMSGDALGEAEISNDVVSSLSEQLTGDRLGHDWKPQMRALCVLEFFLCSGDDERIIANSIMQSRHNFLHFLAKEVPPLREKALAVIQLSHLAKVLPDGKNLSVEKVDGILVLSSQRSTVTSLDFDDRLEDSDSEICAERIETVVRSEDTLNSLHASKKRVSFSEEFIVFERPDSEEEGAQTETCENAKEPSNHIMTEVQEVLVCSPSETMLNEVETENFVARRLLIEEAEVPELRFSPMLCPGGEADQLVSPFTDIQHHGDEPILDNTTDWTLDWALSLREAPANNHDESDGRVGISDIVTKGAPHEESRRRVPFIPWGIELTIPEHKDSLQRFAEQEVQAFFDS